MSDQWKDEEEDNFDNGDSEFWNEFGNPNDVNNMIEINRQQEFEIAHKQLNIDILEKAIRVAKDRKIWWLFASGRSRFKAIKTVYRNMLRIVEDNI